MFFSWLVSFTTRDIRFDLCPSYSCHVCSCNNSRFLVAFDNLHEISLHCPICLITPATLTYTRMLKEVAIEDISWVYSLEAINTISHGVSGTSYVQRSPKDDGAIDVIGWFNFFALGLRPEHHPMCKGCTHGAATDGKEPWTGTRENMRTITIMNFETCVTRPSLELSWKDYCVQEVGTRHKNKKST